MIKPFFCAQFSRFYRRQFVERGEVEFLLPGAMSAL
jgi:hypothetical protein